MKHVWKSALGALGAGLLIVVPLYLAMLLLLKAMKSVLGLVQPVARLMPDWFPARENLLALLFVMLVCFLVGAAVRTPAGRAAAERLEKSFFERIPGYALLRSLTQQVAGRTGETAWQPVLAEIEDALVPAFVIEELDDGRYTVFVPSVPTPLAGAVYILAGDRVHLLDVPFTQAIRSVSRWGFGCKDLAAAVLPGDR
jgi:uncharacterized membrane protein